MGTDESQDDGEALTAALRALVELLEEVDEPHWSTWFRRGLARLERGDGWGVDHTLQAFGGMGSASDLVLFAVNGHRVRQEDEPAVNRRLQVLLDQTHTCATRLRRRGRQDR